MWSSEHPPPTTVSCGNRAGVPGTAKWAKCSPCYKRMKSAQALEHSGCLTYPGLEHQEGFPEEVTPKLSLKRDMGVGQGRKARGPPGGGTA